MHIPQKHYKPTKVAPILIAAQSETDKYSLSVRHNIVRSSAHATMPKHDQVYTTVSRNRRGVDLFFDNKYSIYRRAQSRRYRPIQLPLIEIPPFHLEDKEFPTLLKHVHLNEHTFLVVNGGVTCHTLKCGCSTQDHCDFSMDIITNFVRYVVTDHMFCGDVLKSWFIDHGCSKYKELFVTVQVVPQGALMGKPIKHEHEHVHAAEPGQVEEVLRRLENITVDHKVPALESLNSLFQPIANLMNEDTFIVFVLSFSLLMSVQTTYKIPRTTKIVFFGLVATIVYSKIYSRLPPNLITTIFKWFGDFVNPQGPEEAFGLIVQAISSVVFCTQVGFNDVSTFGNSFSKMVAHTTTFSKSVEMFKDWFLKLFVGIATECGYNFTFLLNKHESEYKQIQLQIHNLVKSVEKNEGTLTVQMRNELVALNDRVLSLERAIPETNNYSVLKGSMRGLKQCLAPLLDKNITVSAANSKPKPFALFLTGGTACGKTSFLKDINSLLISYYLTDVQRKDYIANPSTYAFTKAGGKFYDGATMSTIAFFFHDLFSQIETPGSDSSEGMDILMLCGSNAYKLPMAECSAKKNSYVSPYLVVGATNVKQVDGSLLKGMNNPDAVARRMSEFCYEMTVRPEFEITEVRDGKTIKTGKLDFEKYQAAKKTTVYPNAHFFRKYDMGANAEPRYLGEQIDTLSFLNLLHVSVIAHIESLTAARDDGIATMEHTRKILPVDVEAMKDFKFTVANLRVTPQMDVTYRGFPDDFDTASEGSDFVTHASLRKKYTLYNDFGQKNSGLPTDTRNFIDYVENDIDFPTVREFEDEDETFSNCESEIISETVLFGPEQTSREVLRCIKKYVKLMEDQSREEILGDSTLFEEKVFSMLDHMDAMTLVKLSKLKLDDSIFYKVLKFWDKSRSYFYNVYMRCLEKAKDFSTVFSRFMDNTYKHWQWFSNISVFGVKLSKIMTIAGSTILSAGCVGLVIKLFCNWFGNVEKSAVEMQGNIVTIKRDALELKEPARSFIDCRNESAVRLSLRIHFKNGSKVHEISGQSGYFVMTTILMTPKHFLRVAYGYCNNACVSKVEMGIINYLTGGEPDYYVISNTLQSDVTSIPFPEGNYLYGQDICLLRLPTSLLKRKDIRKYMASNTGAMRTTIDSTVLKGVFAVQSTDTESLSEKEVTFTSASVSISYNLPPSYACPCCGDDRKYPDIVRNVYSNVTVMNGTPTNVGDCGAIGYIHDERLYKLRDKNSKTPIIAYLHSAASSSRSFGVKLRRQDFDFLDEYLGVDSESFVERVREQMSITNRILNSMDIPSMEFPIETSRSLNEFPQFTPVGSAPPYNMCGKSELNKTPVYKHPDFKGVLKEMSHGFSPAVLHPIVKDGVSYNPYVQALAPYGTNHVRGSTLNMKLVSGILSSHENSLLIKNSVPSKLTLNEAIEGIPGEINGVNRKSSMGYFLKVVSDHVNKTIPGADFSAQGMWGHEEYIYNSTPEIIFRKMFSEICDQLEEGRRMCNISTPSLKDELVSREKRDLCKTRLFFTCDKLYFMVKKAYTAAFAKSIADSRGKASCQIGTNMYTESDRIYSNLRVHGHKALCLDFSKFDKTMIPAALGYYADLERKFYEGSDPRHNLARETLLEELNPVYRTVQGEGFQKSTVYCAVRNVTNSGDFMTAIMNSCASKYLIILFCIKILLKYKYDCPDFDLVELSILKKVTKEVIDNVYIITYGDDSITVPNVLYIKYITMDRIIEAAATVGMSMTNESDDCDASGYVNIEDVTFLGRQFICRDVNHTVVVDAALREESIWKRLCFYRGYFDVEVEKQKIEEVLKESTLHGRKYFEKALSIVKRICNEVYSYTLDVTDFESYYCMIKDSESEFYENYSAYKISKKRTVVDTLVDVSFGIVEPDDTSVQDTHITCKNLKESNTNVSVKNTGLIDMSLNNVERVVLQMDEGGRTSSSTVVPETTTTWCEKTGTTCYIESGGKTELKVPTLILENSITSQTMSIAQFLEKTQLLTTINFTTASVQNDNLYNINVNDILLNNVLFSQKLAGFEFMRGTAKFRIEVNASPFHQFICLARYVPNLEDREIFAPGSTNIYDRALVAKIQQPSMYFNADDKVAELDFPYVGTTPFTAVAYAATHIGKVSTWGRFSIDVVQALKTGTGGSTDITLSVFVSFHDVELANPVVPQMDMGRGKAKKTKAKGSSTSVDSIPLIKEGTGKLSNGLMAVSSLASSLGDIPGLSALSTPVAWTARVAASVASFFGYSKPKPDGFSGVARNNFYYTASAEGTDFAAPLSVMYDSAITQHGTHSLVDKDEMSFAYLFKIPQLVTSFDMGIGNITGDVLFSTNVSPVAYYSTVNSTYAAKTLSARQGAPLYYFGRMFSKYRGSLKFHFQVSKTIYHTGKLLITFTAASNPVATTLNNSGYLFRTIVDLSEQSHFEIDLPHLPQIPWLRTMDSTGNVLDRLGVLEVRVLNALRAPPTVSPAINFFVTMTAGDDFEYAVPSNLTVPCVPVIPQMDELPPRAIGDAVIRAPSLDIDCTTIGERISGLKPLTNRLNYMARASSGNAPTNTPETVYPHIMSGVTINVATGALLYPALYGDIISYVVACFGFYRGSMRISTNTYGPNCYDVMLSSNMRTQALAAGQTDTGIITSGPLAPFFPLAITDVYNRVVANGITRGSETPGIFYVQAPYYCTTSASYSVLSTGKARTTYLNSDPESCVTSFNNDNTRFRIYSRSGGEDFSCSYFICCPPTYTGYA